ncbi:MAG: hypothetical protein R3F01_07925 [Lysobacteraceae bacterium]
MSLMRALLGEVTPYLRAVLARDVLPDGFQIEFYVDGPSEEAFREAASCIDTEVLADFPPEIQISHRVIRLDAPINIPVGDGLLVFLRKESN